ncbi:aryl-alcohol dehydrogenase [Xylariaceae sp. FL0804]|nr:aryl-alcohol dehydrogenase [Xylariaceae sp. FL0804]
MSSSNYDFIVVGGGTAGLVVASRLAEDLSQRVLVLEAGPDATDSPMVNIPALYQGLLTPDTAWDFKTQPQSGLNGRSINLEQGRVLGGSSATNAMVYAPPTKASINAWESLGNAGWNWDSLRDYYYKTFTSPTIDESRAKSLGIASLTGPRIATKGPIQTSFPGNDSHPLRELWEDTFKAMGYNMPDDPFSNPSVGAFSNLASIDPISKGRSYAANAYYGPVKHQDNIQLISNAMVEKITFTNGSLTPLAHSVLYRRDDEIYTAYAGKEVIVAAGTLQSPKLLELSGVGDARRLKKYGIDVVADLPGVGENLQDHIVCGITFEAKDDIETLDGLLRQEPEEVSKAMQDYATSQSGLLTSVGITTYAYMPAISSFTEAGPTALEGILARDLYSLGAGPQQQKRDRAVHEVIKTLLRDPKQPSAAYLSLLAQSAPSQEKDSVLAARPAPGKFFTLAAFLTQPLARGTVHIQSDSATSHAAIDPRYLSNAVDLDLFARHVLYLRTVATSPPLADMLLKQPLQFRDAAAADLLAGDLDGAAEYVRAVATSLWHPCGTCAMLPTEMGGVVGSQLKVHGVEGLRVVDASVFPLIPNTNPQATVYAVAERAADMIKEEYKLK